MTKARFRRRKDDRPAEITAAAMDAFAEHGYDATPVASVAERAGVSKGLLYRYFSTKEDLFKAVVRRFIVPRVDALQAAVASSELGAEDFLRGPFLDFAKQIPRSRARFVLRLMIAEGYKHPDLTRWYWEHVASHGLAALQQLVERGVHNGEFRPSALERFPQLLLSPVILSVIWTLVFQCHHKLDTDAFLEAHIDLLLSAIRAEGIPPDTAS
ncbi:MAG: TetR/AcrR family transcriptional regulator [Woeseia sp.]